MRPARNLKTVTTCPVGSLTDWLSTAIAPPRVETGVHPGCSVAVVVVGGAVVVVVSSQSPDLPK